MTDHDLHHQLNIVQGVLAHRATPRTQEETFRVMAEALNQALGQSRLLFYLGLPWTEIEPLSLIPCPAQRLDPGLYVHGVTTAGVQDFRFQTGHAYGAPLKLASYSSGYLFVERLAQPLSRPEQSLVAMVATQTAHDLNFLCRLAACVTSPGWQVSLVIDQLRGLVWINDRPLSLSKSQVAALQVLYHHHGQPCSRRLLCQAVYPGENLLAGERQERLEPLIYRLRQKLAGMDDLVTIKTVSKLGYQLEIGARQHLNTN